LETKKPGGGKREKKNWWRGGADNEWGGFLTLAGKNKTSAQVPRRGVVPREERWLPKRKEKVAKWGSE